MMWKMRTARHYNRVRGTDHSTAVRATCAWASSGAGAVKQAVDLLSEAA
jgi:hypothetical protein